MKGTYLTFTFTTQIVQNKRVVLFPMLHVFVIIVLEGVRSFQRVHRLLPGVVVIHHFGPI